MNRQQLIESLIASRSPLKGTLQLRPGQAEVEGGCGVIGMAASVPISGRHLLQALQQMRNRGNGKGGGAAAVGLDADFFGVQPSILANDYLLAVAYLDGSARSQVESTFIEPTFIVDGTFQVPTLPDFRSLPGLEIQPPDVRCYFVRVRPDVRVRFQQQHGIADDHDTAVEDEIVYQNTYQLNRTFYAATGDKRAFVLSHGKNLLVLKMVGYGDDVFRYYRLENLRAHVWIGHHRYPTRGKVWHPGGAHPFTGMHEALVHNGDFANYTSICTYLAQRNMYPLFITDTSMLRPQVFALQQGTAAIGFAASEKQAIDAALESLAREDSRFWSRADLYWNARGGSHTDGGAFIFTVHASESGEATLQCMDKFGQFIEPGQAKRSRGDGLGDHSSVQHRVSPQVLTQQDLSPADLFDQARQLLPTWDHDDVRAFLEGLEQTARHGDGRDCAIEVLTLLMDRHYATGRMKRSYLLALLDRSFAQVVDCIRDIPSRRYTWAGYGSPLPEYRDVTVALDARGYPAEGNGSLSRAIVELYRRGFRRLIV